MQAIVKDLRLHTKALLAATARGEEVEITYRGKPCARLVSADRDESPDSTRNPAFGLWADRQDLEVNDRARRLRQPRTFAEE
ncbi:type II toxin-antitoxin system prevent-host-death family antitoxin [Pistricoccus aurantiacus]|uniref:Type II toxin-antitoxin system prevent-host-death family antitoxin n=1 Tax=Pistricoccus aurantiacus TaxID=1883414 RepID=A0A5B8SP48_9GAMM|nr:type II toxin-antitoxin system prevent-host-death family antitoxin [Pistricoccus aurantiacus]QEA37847.1 type II toxin-antitoxin system prevent-host-death family antitoxin [Pistricoccus aurantiacus]